MDDRKIGKHSIMIDRRENISLTGVIDVISFDEETIVCETELGLVIIKGDNLHVNKLNLDSGELSVDGAINSITYENEGNPLSNRGSFLNKIFK